MYLNHNRNGFNLLQTRGRRDICINFLPINLSVHILNKCTYLYMLSGFPTGVKPHKSRMTDKNDDMIFYEDVNTDFEDGFRLDTGPIHSGLCFKNMQNTNDGVCCDFDVQNANEDYERSYEYKTKDLIKCDNENEDFEDEYVRERKDNCMAAIDQTATETALADEFDIENDLDDWLEDDKDKVIT